MEESYTVLVVEDDVFTSILLTNVIKNDGYNVFPVTTFEQAQKVFTENKIDLAFMDVMLPDGNGYDLCDFVRKDRMSDIPIIMMTALNDSESIDHAFDVGATDFVSKPVVLETIPYKIKYSIKAYESMKGLEKSEAVNRSIIESMPDILIFLDGNGRIVSFTKNLREMMNIYEFSSISLENVLGKNEADIVRSKLPLCKTGLVDPYIAEVYIGGHKKYIEIRLSPAGIKSYICILRDFTEKTERENSLLLYKSIFKFSEEAIVVTDLDHRITVCNESTTKMTGYSTEELIGKKSSLFKIFSANIQDYKKIWSSLLALGHWAGEVAAQHKTGRILPLWLTVDTIYDINGDRTNYVGIVQDISVLKEKEKKLQEAAFTDFLTGMPNRASIINAFTEIAESQTNGLKIGLLYFDIDDFKIVNDSLGHDLGDKIIIELGNRIKNLIGDLGITGRLGGDEFVVLLPDIESKEKLADVAEQIWLELSKPIINSLIDINITASIGIAVYPDDGEDPLSLLKNADLAMYNSKKDKSANYSFFSKKLEVDLNKNVFVNKLAEDNISSDKFYLFMQPIMDASGTPVAFESLTRLNNGGQIMPPSEFIPFIESNNLINKLTIRIFERVAEYEKKLTDRGITMPISVNLPPRFLNHAGYTEILMDFLYKNRDLAGLINIELTENAFIQSAEDIIKTIELIRNLGPQIYLDDFGTGYSSISYLQYIPLDVIKIDKAFVQNVNKESKKYNLCKIIINMAKIFNLKVIAEGVEEKQDISVLDSLGCDLYQGYFFKRPTPAEECIKWALERL